MYKILNINGNDYKFEFSIEASLYGDCIEKITMLMLNIDAGQTSGEAARLVGSVSDIPNTSVVCFYAGLLEHHGPSGDGRVPNLATAKELVKALLKDENSEYNNFYDILSLCTEQMREDGFFDLIGLSAMSNAKPKRQPKTPQDHKKKATKVSEN